MPPEYRDDEMFGAVEPGADRGPFHEHGGSGALAALRVDPNVVEVGALQRAATDRFANSGPVDVGEVNPLDQSHGSITSHGMANTCKQDVQTCVR